MTEKLEQRLGAWRAPWQPLAAVVGQYGKTTVLAALAAAVACHALFLRDGYTGPDGLNEGLQYYWNRSVAISQGRWVMFYTSSAVGNVVMPLVYLLFNALCAAAVTLLLAQLWQLRGKWVLALCATALVVAPAVTMQNLVIYMAYTYGCGMLAFVLAAYLVLRVPGRGAWALAALLLAVGLGCYQAYLGFTAAVIVLTLLLQCLAKEPLAQLGRTMVRSLTMGLGGVVAYFALFHLHLFVLGEEMSTRSGLSDFSPLTFLQNLLPGIAKAYWDFAKYYLNTKQAHLRLPYGLLLLLVVAVCGWWLVRLWRQSRPHALALLGLGLLVPVAFNAAGVALNMSGNFLMTYPLQLMVPFALALFQRLPQGRPARLTRRAGGALAVVVCWFCVIIAYSSYYSAAYSYQYVDTVATAILSRVLNDPQYDSSKRLLIAGLPEESLAQTRNKAYYQLKNSVSEGPFVFWPNWTGVLWGWANYLYAYHGLDAGLIYQEEYEAILDSAEYAAMPLYPAEGCVATFDDIVVVKYQADPPRP